MDTIKVRLKHKVVGGHLLCHMIVGKSYELTKRTLFKGELRDETGKLVFISHNCFEEHLQEI